MGRSRGGGGHLWALHARLPRVRCIASTGPGATPALRRLPLMERCGTTPTLTPSSTRAAAGPRWGAQGCGLALRRTPRAAHASFPAGCGPPSPPQPTPAHPSPPRPHSSTAHPQELRGRDAKSALQSVPCLRLLCRRVDWPLRRDAMTVSARTAPRARSSARFRLTTEAGFQQPAVACWPAQEPAIVPAPPNRSQAYARCFAAIARLLEERRAPTRDRILQRWRVSKDDTGACRFADMQVGAPAGGRASWSCAPALLVLRPRGGTSPFGLPHAPAAAAARAMPCNGLTDMHAVFPGRTAAWTRLCSSCCARRGTACGAPRSASGSQPRRRGGACSPSRHTTRMGRRRTSMTCHSEWAHAPRSIRVRRMWRCSWLLGTQDPAMPKTPSPAGGGHSNTLPEPAAARLQ